MSALAYYAVNRIDKLKETISMKIQPILLYIFAYSINIKQEGSTSNIAQDFISYHFTYNIEAEQQYSG